MSNARIDSSTNNNKHGSYSSSNAISDNNISSSNTSDYGGSRYNYSSNSYSRSNSDNSSNSLKELLVPLAYHITHKLIFNTVITGQSLVAAMITYYLTL